MPASIQPELDEGLFQRTWSSWASQGFITKTGRAGPRAEDWVSGGFVLARLDRPPGVATYGNRVGGFHVDCPNCGEAVARAWGSAVQALKEGSLWVLRCPQCGNELGPNEVHTRPPAALARFAIELRDVGSSELRDRGVFEGMLGHDFRLIGVRG
ncbi:MAG: putative RNA-binding Zn-ribbon protein involved in translation (DUF1610 family) [Cognaticolwellia sp.]